MPEATLSRADHDLRHEDLRHEDLRHEDLRHEDLRHEGEVSNANVRTIAG
jgi:hypothetical protein